jgi:hypothetical protein
MSSVNHYLREKALRSAASGAIAGIPDTRRQEPDDDCRTQQRSETETVREFDTAGGNERSSLVLAAARQRGVRTHRHARFP